MFGWFACCTAALAVNDFDSTAIKDAADATVPQAFNSPKQQQLQHKTGWKQQVEQQADQDKLKPTTVDATPQKPGRVSLRQQRKDQCFEPECAAAADVSVEHPSILSSSVPLTSRSLIAAATGCHSLSASASVQAYQRTAGAIRHQDTGDSPSEIHSELVQQQPKLLSSCSNSCERTAEHQAAGSAQSVLSADDKQQQLHHHHQQQQQEDQPGALPTIRVQTAQSSLNSMLLLESQQHHHQQQHFASSNSCHATASSAGSAVLPLEGAVQVVGTSQADCTAKHGTVAVQSTTRTVEIVTEEPSAAEADSTAQQQPEQQQQDGINRTNTMSTSGDSSTLPPHLQLYRLESGTSFQMADAALSSSSDVAQTASRVMGTSLGANAVLTGNGSDSLTGTFSFPHSPEATLPAVPVEGTQQPGTVANPTAVNRRPAASPSPAAAAGGLQQKSFVQVTGAAKSPFAQLTLQQSVASALISNQQQQQIQQRHSLPLVQQISASAQSCLSAPSIAAATGPGSSSRPSSNATAAAVTGAAMPLTPNSVTPRATRVSWAASSAPPAVEAAVFDVLDPEIASNDSGLRILRQSVSSRNLRHSASATSLSSLTGGFASGSNSSSAVGRNTTKGTLQQLRLAVSMSWEQAGDKTADTGAAAPPGRFKPGFKSILRRSTESLASASLKGTASAFRRSKSAHSNVMHHQQVSKMSAAADAGSDFEQAAAPLPSAFLPASSSSTDLRRSLPPLPPTASGSSALFGSSSGPAAFGRTHTSAAVAGSVSSFATNSNINAIAGTVVHGLLPTSSSGGSNRIMSNVQAVQSLDRQSSASSRVASVVGSFTQTGGSSGSLVALAVNRMHSVASSSNLGAPQTSGSSTSSTTGSTASSTGLTSTGSTTALNGGSTSSLAAQGRTGGMLTAAGVYSSSNSSSSTVQVATAFADAFLAALASGNTKWGSDAVVSKLLHDTAKMLGMDKQLYTGKTAIIRRLNSGMDQLVKMVAANAPDGSTPAGSTTTIADIAGSMPKPVVSVSCPNPQAKPSLAVATYTFKWGIRKFTLRDEFIVKQGQIMRLRRSRA